MEANGLYLGCLNTVATRHKCLLSTYKASIVTEELNFSFYGTLNSHLLLLLGQENSKVPYLLFGPSLHTPLPTLLQAIVFLTLHT